MIMMTVYVTYAYFPCTNTSDIWRSSLERSWSIIRWIIPTTCHNNLKFLIKYIDKERCGIIYICIFFFSNVIEGPPNILTKNSPSSVIHHLCQDPGICLLMLTLPVRLCPKVYYYSYSQPSNRLTPNSKLLPRIREQGCVNGELPSAFFWPVFWHTQTPSHPLRK